MPLDPREALFIDWADCLSRAQSAPSSERIEFLLRQAGCPLTENEPRLALGCSVRIWTVGGLPAAALIAQGVSVERLVEMSRSTMGAAGSMSYLAMPGGSPAGAYRAIVEELGHCSVAHCVSVSLIVAGVSCAAENEFNSQRDLVHLARVTEARADCQSSPPLMALEPALIPIYQEALLASRALAQKASSLAGSLSRKDANEAINALFPAAKASLFALTGSLRNIQKLLAAESDPGKEKEYRAALGLIRSALSPLWPELFNRAAP